MLICFVLQLVTNAKKCVNLLSERLGRKVWFFGDFFSEFDATVYSYLVILYKVQLKNNPLQNHIKGCKNLVDFIKRITRDIFPTESLDILNSMKKVAASTSSFDKRSRIVMEKRSEKDMATLSKVLASVAAVFLMTLFAIRNGVFQKVKPFQIYSKCTCNLWNNPNNSFNFFVAEQFAKL